MAIRLSSLASASVDIFLLCLIDDRTEFVRDVVSNLEQRGYTVSCPWLWDDERSTSIGLGVAGARLSAAIIGSAFLTEEWSASEMVALERVEVRVRHGIASHSATPDNPALMVFDASDGAAVIASKIARACGYPRAGASFAMRPKVCWRCGTSDLSRGSDMLTSAQCAMCANEYSDPEACYDPDPLGMGLVPSIQCCSCGTELDPSFRFRNRDVSKIDQGMKIEGVACVCGGSQFTVEWSGGSMCDDDQW